MTAHQNEEHDLQSVEERNKRRNIYRIMLVAIAITIVPNVLTEQLKNS